MNDSLERSAPRERALAHLDEIEETPEFRRAAKQLIALRAIVLASLDDRQLSQKELAVALYGRSDENYLKAARALMRELRFKLLAYYASAPENSDRFELSDKQYRVEFVPGGKDGARDGGHPSAGATDVPKVKLFGSWSVLAVVVLVITAGAVATVWYLNPWSAPETELEIVPPATVAIEMKKWVFRDANGLSLEYWIDLLDVATGGRMSPTVPYMQQAEQVQICLMDRGAGRAPVIVSVSCPYDVVSGCAVHLIDGQNAHKLDERTLPILPGFPGPTQELHEEGQEAFKAAFRPRSVAAIEFDGDNQHDELLVSVHSWRSFPSQVLVLDPGEDWEVLAEYWNMGHAQSAPLGDFDGDGRDDIAVYGTNNSYQAAFVTFLPSRLMPRGFRGRSPDGPNKKVMTEVKAYPVVGYTVKLPKSELARNFEYARIRSRVKSVTWNPDRSTMWIQVKDGFSVPGFGEPILEFLMDLRTPSFDVRIASDDLYFQTYRRKIHDGTLEDQWNLMEDQDLEGLRDELRSGLVAWNSTEENPEWGSFDPDDLVAVLYGGR